jgi:hypothetical protein
MIWPMRRYWLAPGSWLTDAGASSDESPWGRRRRSDPSGGRAKLEAAAEREHCSVDMANHGNGSWLNEQPSPFPHGRRPMDTDEGNGPVQSVPAPAHGWRHQGNGQCPKAGKVSSSQGRLYKPPGETKGDDDTDGSGRSSTDAVGQHNPGEQQICRARGWPCGGQGWLTWADARTVSKRAFNAGQRVTARFT